MYSPLPLSMFPLVLFFFVFIFIFSFNFSVRFIFFFLRLPSYLFFYLILTFLPILIHFPRHFLCRLLACSRFLALSLTFYSFCSSSVFDFLRKMVSFSAFLDVSTVWRTLHTLPFCKSFRTTKLFALLLL